MRLSRLRSAAAVPMLVILLGVLTACGDSTAGEEVASASDGQAAAASASPSMSAADRDRAFAQCIRDNGIPDFPDPDGENGFRDAMMNSGIDRDKLRTAMEACQDLRPGGGEQQQLDAAQQEQRLQWAQCMRDNGVDMPDPDPNKGGFLLGGGNISPDDPAFQKAMEACQDKFVSGRG